jgi:hypothetical protein
VEDNIHTGKQTGLGHLPSTSIEINRAWCLAATIACDLLCWLRLLCLHGTLASAEPKTLRYRLCCIPQPASCAANANTQSASPEPGPGQANSLPASARHSRCPHQLDVDQHKPAPTTAPTPGPWNPALTQRDSRASNPNSTLTTTSTTIMKINIWEPEATPVNPRMIKASRRPRPEPPDSSSVYRTRVRHLNSTEAAVDRAHLPLTQQRPVATPPLRGALASCSTGRPIGSSWTP